MEKQIDFIIHPSEGFINTKFGVTTTRDPQKGKGIILSNNDKIPRKCRYIFDSSSEESAINTDWVDSDSFVYYRFKESGPKCIRMELMDGSYLEKEITVHDSIRFGTGKTRDITLALESNKILFKKSNGLTVCNTSTNDEYFLPINIGKIFEIRKNRVLIISDSKAILINLSNGQMIYNLVGKIEKYSISKKIIVCTERPIYETIDGERTKVKNSKIKIYKFYKDIPHIDEFDGTICNTNINNLRIIYTNDGKLSCYFIGKREHCVIGGEEFVDVKGDDNQFIIYQDTTYKRVWDINTRKDILFCNFWQEVIPITNKECIALSDDLSIVKKDFKTIQYSIEYKSNFKYSKLAICHPYGGFQIIDYNFEKINYAELSGEGDFINWLGAGKFFHVKLGGQDCIYSTNSMDKLIEFSGEVVSCFYYKGKWRLAINDKPYIIAGNTVTIMNLESGKSIYSISGRIEVENIATLKKYNQLWISYGNNDYKVFEGISSKQIASITLIAETDDYYLTSDKIMRKTNLRTLKKIDIQSNALCPLYDNELSMILLKEDDGYYVHLNPLKRKNNRKLKIQDVDKIYTSSDIHPKKDYAVVSADGMSEIIDLNTFEVIEIINSNFIKFDQTGNIYCSDSKERYWGMPRIFDSETFEEIEAQNLHQYKFTSIDGKYGIGLISNNIYELVDIEEDKIIAKIENIHPPLDWTNFIAFHPVYDIIAIVGKQSYAQGWIKTIRYNKSGSIYFCDSDSRNKALWKCGYSNNGRYLASYDSTPNTYVYNVSNKSGLHQYRTISNRSFECFSPDSKNIVLSDRGYRAITEGGEGWITSNMIWIMYVSTWKEKISYKEHNSDILFVNYSDDGSRLISRSQDGIVIVRNILAAHN